MKHWQFFLAILILLILILPIYEPYSKNVINEIDSVEKDVKKSKDLIGTLTNEMAEFRTEQYNAKVQMSGSNDISNYILSHPYDVPAKLPDGTYVFTGGRANQYCSDEGNQVSCNKNTIGPSEKMQLTNLGDGYYTIKGGKDGKYCSYEGDKLVCNGSSEKIKIMDIGEGYYNLIGGKDSKYCSDDTTIVCNKDKPGVTERIKITMQ
jgi:hypothetical protein